MTARTFARWVETYAETLQEDRQQMIDFARSAPADFWGRPSPNEGWTNKDLLAHIVAPTDQGVERLLRAVISDGKIDRSVVVFDTDAANAEGVAARRERSVDELIVELQASGEEMQDLLSQLTDAHEHYRQDDPPFVLSGFMELVMRARHDLEHLAQLRGSLEVEG